MGHNDIVDTEPNALILAFNLGPEKLPMIQVGLPDDMVKALAAGAPDRTKLRWLAEQAMGQLARYVEQEYGRSPGEKTPFEQMADRVNKEPITTPRAEERDRIAAWLRERSSSRDPDDPSREKGLLMEALAKSIDDGAHWTALEAVEEGP